MAFSTQREFFHVPFKNESYEFECIEACVKLKTYPSTVDDRSWSANEDRKSQFVADLVACNTVKSSRGGEGAGGSPRSRGADGRRPEDVYGGNLVVGDSLINAADDTIGRLHDLMIKNNILKKKLDDSNDKLKTAKEESDDIKRIMDQRYDPQKSKDLKKKIKELADAGKITPQDEKDLGDLQKAIDDMNKAHDILEAENGNLKRLIEKQSKRCRLDSVKIDPEKSNDIPYLQRKIDDLGKEVALLRQAEDEKMKDGGGASGKGGFSAEKDPSNIQRILAERDALRKKCKALEELSDKVDRLEQNANEAARHSGDLENNLEQHDQCMNDMVREMQDMQNYYENEVDKAKGNEEILKCRCKQLQQEVMAAKGATQRAKCQQMEIDVLRNELRKRDIAINAYDCQYKQLMLKAKMFKTAGYRFLDDLPPDCCDCSADGEEEEDGD